MVPVNNPLGLKEVKGQSDFADVQSHAVLAEVDLLLHVVPKIPAQQKINHEEHILLVLEGEPEVDEEGMIEIGQQRHLRQNILHRVLLDTRQLVHVFHGVHLLGAPLAHDADLRVWK